MSIDDPLGDQLKSYFDDIMCGPVPDRLMRLTEALEAAFDRGELCCSSVRRAGKTVA